MGRMIVISQSARKQKARPARALARAKRLAHGAKLFLKSRSIVQRTYHVIDDKKLIYLTMYKAACSSIMASMYALPEKEHYLRIHHTVGREENAVLNIGREEYADYYKFTFVRNPLERLVSCYENKYHADKKLLAAGGMKQLYFDNYLFGYLRKDLGFAGFARKVAHIPDRLADRHFVGQSFLTHDGKGRATLDFVGRFEELPEAFEPIREKYDLPALKTYNVTDKGNWMDYYDLPTAHRMIKRYRRDINAFGYQKEADALIAYLESKKSS